MSGHSKWSQIKRQKAVNDTARSTVFSKLARRITVESKKAGGDISLPSLRAAIEKAKEANMPRNNIERAVLKGAAPDAGSLESITYETYGPGGVAILILALTDNRNRTAQEIKRMLSQNGCELASPGSASWAFTRVQDGTYVPSTTVSLSETDYARLIKILDTIDAHDDVEEIFTNARSSARA